MQTQSKQAGDEDAAAKFFACTDSDMAEYREEQERNRPPNQQALIKQQFVMSKSNAQPGKYPSSYNG